MFLAPLLSDVHDRHSPGPAVWQYNVGADNKGREPITREEGFLHDIVMAQK
jgi:hypothetical protein